MVSLNIHLLDTPVQFGVGRYAQRDVVGLIGIAVEGQMRLVDNQEIAILVGGHVVVGGVPVIFDFIDKYRIGAVVGLILGRLAAASDSLDCGTVAIVAVKYLAFPQIGEVETIVCQLSILDAGFWIDVVSGNHQRGGHLVVDYGCVDDVGESVQTCFQTLGGAYARLHILGYAAES